MPLITLARVTTAFGHLPPLLDDVALQVEAGERIAVIGRNGTDGRRVTGPAVGLVATSAGIAAACGAEWTAAEEHFQTALGQADGIPHRIAQPDARARSLARRSRCIARSACRSTSSWPSGRPWPGQWGRTRAADRAIRR